MRLNQAQIDFLNAVIDNEFSSDTINGVPKEEYLGQLSPDLSEIYDELLAFGYLNSHPEASFYMALASMVEGQPGVDAPVWLWLRGAAEVNIGESSQARFIRNYNNSQAEARNGGAVTKSDQPHPSGPV